MKQRIPRQSKAKNFLGVLTVKISNPRVPSLQTYGDILYVSMLESVQQDFSPADCVSVYVIAIIHLDVVAFCSLSDMPMADVGDYSVFGQVVDLECWYCLKLLLWWLCPNCERTIGSALHLSWLLRRFLDVRYKLVHTAGY